MSDEHFVTIRSWVQTVDDNVSTLTREFTRFKLQFTVALVLLLPQSILDLTELLS